MILAVTVLVLFGRVSSEDLHLISLAPTSINVSEGAQAEFTCQTTFGLADVIIFFALPSGIMFENRKDTAGALPEGGSEIKLSFTATAAVNKTVIQCVARNVTNSSNMEISSQASLLVQGPPSGVGDLRVEYEDVCCTLVAWDDPYTLSGVPITGYNITVNNISTSPDTGTLNNTLCLTEPGRHVVIVTPLIDAVLGDTAQITVDIPETKFNLLVQQISNCLEFTVEISEECSDNMPSNVTLLLSELSSTIASFTIPVASNDDNSQVMKSIKLEEYLLNRLIQALALVTYTNGVTISTVTKNFSTFDVQAVNYSISSMGVVCVECDLVPGSQAQGCHVTLDCDNGDVIEQDFIKQDLAAASGCLLSAPSTPSSCTLLIYDIEKNGSMSSNPVFTLDDVLVSGVLSSPTTIDIVITSTPPGSTAAVIVVVVLVILFMICLSVGALIGVCLYKRVKRNHKPSLSNDQEPNMYQLSQRQDSQGPQIPVVQYTQVETPAVGNTVVLPVENHPVTYSYIDIQRLGVSSVDVMMDHKQLMLFVAPRVSSKWYHMGVALALTPPFLEDIEQNSGGSPEHCISDVFQAWREQRSRPYTWESLLIALRGVGVEELEFARELELQVQSLQQQQQTTATTSLPAPGEMYSRLQHSSNQSTPSTTPCRHVPNTNYESLPHTSNITVSAATMTSLIKPGLTLDQLISELTSQVASKWKGVGVALAITPPSLETIGTRNCQEPTMCMTGVVQLWKHREPRPYTLRTLITVLKSIGEHEYALQLEHYHVTTNA